MTDIIVKDIKNGSEYYYGGSADVSAEDVSYDNSSSGAVANNLQDAMDEVFQSVSNGKELIADAITDKGVSTSATDSFQTMANNIARINTSNNLLAYSTATQHITNRNTTLHRGYYEDANSILAVNLYASYSSGNYYDFGTSGVVIAINKNTNRVYGAFTAFGPHSTNSTGGYNWEIRKTTDGNFYIMQYGLYSTSSGGYNVINESYIYVSPSTGYISSAGDEFYYNTIQSTTAVSLTSLGDGQITLNGNKIFWTVSKTDGGEAGTGNYNNVTVSGCAVLIPS